MYSVAQHCYIISHKVPPKYALEGLLHDAAEAYVGDTIKPLKAFLPDMKLVEDAVDAVIREKFGLPETISPEVKKADYFAVATERRDVLPENLAVDWGSLPEPWPEKIVPVTPNRAQRLFLQRFEELYNGDS